MAPPTPAQKKADERRARNLEAANISRQRRREQISSLEQERARLKEANELLRSRLNISSSATLGPSRPLPKTPASRSSKVELGPAMRKLTNKREIDGKVAVDLLDRALSGGKGKPTPLDPELVKKFHDASKVAPKDVKRPYQYLDKGGSSSGHKKDSKKDKDKGSSSKSKGSSSKKR